MNRIEPTSTRAQVITMNDEAECCSTVGCAKAAGVTGLSTIASLSAICCAPVSCSGVVMGGIVGTFGCGMAFIATALSTLCMADSEDDMEEMVQAQYVQLHLPTAEIQEAQVKQ